VLALLGCEPVAYAQSKPAHALYSSNSGSQLRAEETGIGRFIGDATNCSQTEIDCRGSVLLLFEIDPVPRDHRAVEREPVF
jgi:hypothetical protein